jgi:hypothetical protein
MGIASRDHIFQECTLFIYLDAVKMIHAGKPASGPGEVDGPVANSQTCRHLVNRRGRALLPRRPDCVRTELSKGLDQWKAAAASRRAVARGAAGSSRCRQRELYVDGIS